MLLGQKAEDVMPVMSAWQVAHWAYKAMKKGYSTLVWFCYVPHLASFGDWFSQLWAESLGKDGCGSTPISVVGVTDQHSLQQLFLGGPKDKVGIFLNANALIDDQLFPLEVPQCYDYLRGKSVNALLRAEYEGSKAAWEKFDIPYFEIDVKKADEYEVGKLIMTMELATAFTGWLLGINPFDQPHVEFGKRYAIKVISGSTC